ncbi:MULTISPECIES: minor capsid protein [Lactobacillaceae]|uniref:minor capsid protein n=1 Tax=Lactobacillaceae TaxID=33958 RepID=UPI0014566457|nr:minor capsid protein [Lactobacillus sp. HBUAS51381]NLR08706.1 minor capsid protein [Lactobacillus sp. HBUAS51381]
MGIFSWIQKQLSNRTEKSTELPTKTVEPYISSNRDMQEFEAQARHFPSMRIDKRLMKPLEEGLLPGEIILLEWSNHKSEHASIPAYFEYDYGLNATIDRHKLARLGYLTIASPSESLKSLRVPELKGILRSNGQKLSGKKADLIHRIADNIEESSYSNTISDRTLVCTPAGNLLLEKYNYLVWAHKHNSKDGVINVANALNHSIEEMQSKLNYSRSQAGLTKHFLTLLEDYDADAYEILGSLDIATCAKCGEMDGRVFQASHAKPGVNLPPFHDGCRCEIVPHISGLSTPDKRVARNPKTGKTENITHQNYKEWHEAMVQKYGTEVFK